MAQRNPEECNYLAVVSEWTSTTPRGGFVGNAYPLVNLTTSEVVAAPEEEFPNPGAVFLTNRGTLHTWDYVVLRPRQNALYNDSDLRQCFYIPSRPPDRLETPTQADNVAVVLNHTTFDLVSATRQLLHPWQSVTPIFFVQRGQTIFGPLLRDFVHLSAMEDVLRIDWRPARDDGIVYEFTPDELKANNLRLVEYAHPDQGLNRVIASPIQFALGAVRQATSSKPRDALPDANLIEWYVQRCPTVDVPADVLTSLKGAFKGKPTDDVPIMNARLKRIEREMYTHSAFQEQRERFARQYAESEKGQQRMRELLEQAIAKKATEIQAEVDAREGKLAGRRAELDRLFAEANLAHQESLQTLEQERAAARQQVEELQAAMVQLQGRLSEGVGQLAARVTEQLPLLAALTAGRPDAAAPQASSGRVLPARLPQEFRPVPPTAKLRPAESEAKLVDDLHVDLANRGLHFARDFVANAYVCLKAEPLNLIIGPPGYGKSMLVTALARSLGHGDAFLRIAVQRSWSEDRYLLGFYDSFNGRYDPGTTGLVPRMLQADADWKRDAGGIYVVLLDEFNLAAPEYYFSQLLQILPSDDERREVSLYDAGRTGGDGFPGRVTLNANLRFWGTINYDETTERLSPRTLDRTGMIFLSDADVKTTLEEQTPAAHGVAAGDPFGRFLRDAEDCPDERWNMVAKVIDFLRNADPAFGPRVELSPRVRRAVKRYLANSIDVLPARTAVDFVVQQRILPVIRGRGEEFFARMTGLAQELSNANLARSAAHVGEAMRRSEQHFGEIDFLSY